MLETAAHRGAEDDDSSCVDEDTFQLQHHHLLACLERTTVGLHNVLSLAVYNIVAQRA